MYNNTNNEQSLNSLFDLEMISDCVFHISVCLKSMSLKSSTFLMLGPVYSGKLSILNLSYYINKRELSFLDKNTSWQELVKDLMDVLIVSLNKLKPQSI